MKTMIIRTNKASKINPKQIDSFSKAPRGWPYSRIWTCCYNRRVITIYAVKSRLLGNSPEAFFTSVCVKIELSGAKICFHCLTSFFARIDNKFTFYTIQLNDIFRIRCIKPICLLSIFLIKNVCSNSFCNCCKYTVFRNMDS